MQNEAIISFSISTDIAILQMQDATWLLFVAESHSDQA
jgi:hypothetical protein